MKIGIIGAGAIAHFLLNKINDKQCDSLQIQSVLVRNKEKYQSLESKFGVKLFTDLSEFLNSEIDIVVEAADIEAVKSLIPEVVKQKDAVIISIGAFADEALFAEVSELVKEHNHTIHLPSGAIGGVDLLQNAHSIGKMTYVSLTTRKPAKTLVNENIDEAKIVFEGKAVDAIKRFPSNMNISILLSLAGIGAEKTHVCLIADPNIDTNVHQIEMKGEFGEAHFSITNHPLPENPKTSYLAAMSILGTLKRLNENIKIG